MKSGFIISGALHIILLLATVFNLPWMRPDPVEEIRFTDVTVMSQAEFDAVQSSEPQVNADIGAMSVAPTAEANDAAQPGLATSVTQTVQDVTEAPTERDTDANLDALLVPLANPEVAVVEPLNFAPSIAEDSSPTFGAGVDGDAQVASVIPVQPRTAPRVASEPSLSQPNIDTSSDRNVPDTSTDVVPSEPTPEEPPSSVEDTVTEIVPEAKPFPELSAAPPRRPTSIPNIQAQIDAAAAEAVAAATPAEPATPDEPANTDEVDLSALIGGLDPEVTPTTTQPAAQISLNGSQKRSIGAAVGDNWNVTRIYGIENYEQFVIRVSVLIDINGKIIGPVEMVEPANPTGSSYQLAFEIARSAILQTSPIPIPPGTLSGDTRLVLKFDPATGVGF